MPETKDPKQKKGYNSPYQRTSNIHLHRFAWSVCGVRERILIRHKLKAKSLCLILLKASRRHYPFPCRHLSWK